MAAKKPNELSGKILGAWRLQKPLGKGGQGIVWAAEREGGKAPPRALKTSFAASGTERERFRREIRLLQECVSPHVLQLVEAMPEFEVHLEGFEPFAYYVSERCSRTLAEEVERSRDLADHLSLYAQACDGVAALHDRAAPVIHRDIKPSNFLIAVDPRRVVLADFGIARELTSETNVTETHEVVGSLFFRAPEVHQGYAVDERADVYSMGRLLEWLLTGRVPKNHVPARVPRGDQLSDDLCETYDRIIEKATSPVPDDRFESVVELRRALPEVWLDAKPVTVSTGSAMDHPAPEATQVLDSALELARANDTIGWRQLEQRLRRAYPAAIEAWREHWHPRCPPDAELEPLAQSLVDAALPRLMLALAGVFSGKPAFSDQRHTVDDILGAGGSRSGRSAIADAPLAVLWVFHHLHGALCLEARAPELAVALACTRVQDARSTGTRPIHEEVSLVGWPPLPKNATNAWRFLLGLRDRHEALLHLFALDSDYTRAVASYNAVLTLLELGRDAKKLRGIQDWSQVNLEVPPAYLLTPREIQQFAVRRVFEDPEVVSMVADAVGGDAGTMRELWSGWSSVSKAWVERVTNHEVWADELDLGELA